MSSPRSFFRICPQCGLWHAVDVGPWQDIVTAGAAYVSRTVQCPRCKAASTVTVTADRVDVRGAA